MQHALVTRQLHHAAVGRERTAQNRKPTFGLQRGIELANHLLPTRLDNVGDLFEKIPSRRGNFILQ